MASRNGKNRRGASGFVKKSARFSALFTKGTVISRDSTFSRTKKCLRSICFDKGMVFGVVCKIDSGFVVERERCWLGSRRSEFSNE
eukprot:681850-Pleurochrysis_carterae.AAC.1